MVWSGIKRLLPFFRTREGKSTANHLSAGARGERVAAAFLRRRKHRVLSRNFTCSVGEIDLVTRDGDTIVFVEVKSRRDEDAQDILETVTPVKWSRVERAARQYISLHRLEEYPCRFDLMTVVWNEAAPTIEHTEGAFEPRRA